MFTFSPFSKLARQPTLLVDFRLIVPLPLKDHQKQDDYYFYVMPFIYLFIVVGVVTASVIPPRKY